VCQASTKQRTQSLRQARLMLTMALPHSHREGEAHSGGLEALDLGQSLAGQRFGPGLPPEHPHTYHVHPKEPKCATFVLVPRKQTT
jgi:hypothetical protein